MCEVVNVSRVNLRRTGSDVDFLDSSDDVNDVISDVISDIIIIRTNDNAVELLMLGMT